jgi:SM-20-related protein
MSDLRATEQTGTPRQFSVHPDFLDAADHTELLAWVLKNERKFEPTMVSGTSSEHDGEVAPSWRVSMAVRDFGPLMPVIRQRLIDELPFLFANLGVTPFVPAGVDMELVASNDGAFFKPHIDTFIGDERKTSDRLISSVYYFHTEPKAFSGGALRLYSFVKPGAESSFTDIQPEQNSLVAFPSWELHEVRPVSCPSKRFSDCRFSVNLWLLR